MPNAMATAKDFITQALRTIEVEHNSIHEGAFFEAPNLVTVGTGSTVVISFETPSNKYVHYRNEKVESSGEKVIIGLQEGATITGGTTVSSYNHNRVSSKTASSIIKTGVTLSTAGTTISIGYIGGGTGVGGSRQGGDTTNNNEIVLKTGTTYAITIVNGGAGQASVLCSPIFYEDDQGI